MTAETHSEVAELVEKAQAYLDALDDSEDNPRRIDTAAELIICLRAATRAAESGWAAIRRKPELQEEGRHVALSRRVLEIRRQMGKEEVLAVMHERARKARPIHKLWRGVNPSNSQHQHHVAPAISKRRRRSRTVIA